MTVQLDLLHDWLCFVRPSCMDVKDTEIGHMEWPNVIKVPTR